MPTVLQVKEWYCTSYYNSVEMNKRLKLLLSVIVYQMGDFYIVLQPLFLQEQKYSQHFKHGPNKSKGTSVMYT